MEKFSLEKAQTEAKKIKTIAEEIKENKLKDDPWKDIKSPSTNDFRQAEKLIDSGYDKNLVTFMESTKIAQGLIEKYKNELIDDYDAWDADGVNAGNESIRKFSEQIPKEIFKRYHGHGIIRNSEKQQLAALINICTNKCIIGETGKMAESGYINAYTHGGYLIISKIDELLPKIVNNKPVCHMIAGSTSALEPGKILNSDENGEREAWEANIGAVVVNLSHYPIIDELKKMFPDITFIKANELPSYVANEVEAKDKK